jgi:hypothetical protein
MVANLTERQQKWFASVQASLERDTGKTLAEWVEIVRRDCPETTTGKQSAWLKANYGIGVNRAAQILDALNPAGRGDDPETLRTALWKDAQSTAILHALEALIAQIPDVVPTQRKGYSAWSRKIQFAALKPVRGGQASLGLALPPETDPRLEPCGKESWSERLKSKITLTSPDMIDANLLDLLRQAADKS